MNRKFLDAITERLNTVTGYTRWNSYYMFTPKSVAELIAHIEECHRILWPLSETNDYELPYQVPPLIEQARELRKKVS